MNVYTKTLIKWLLPMPCEIKVVKNINCFTMNLLVNKWIKCNCLKKIFCLWTYILYVDTHILWNFVRPLSYSLLFIASLETGFLCVTSTGCLDSHCRAGWPRTQKRSTFLCLLSAGIKGVLHYHHLLFISKPSFVHRLYYC